MTDASDVEMAALDDRVALILAERRISEDEDIANGLDMQADFIMEGENDGAWACGVAPWVTCLHVELS